MFISADSKVTQIYIYTFFHILFHDGLSQDIEYNSLCSTVGPCGLSILCIRVCIFSSQTPSPSLPHLSHDNHKSVLYEKTLFLSSIFYTENRKIQPLSSNIVDGNLVHTVDCLKTFLSASQLCIEDVL